MTQKNSVLPDLTKRIPGLLSLIFRQEPLDEKDYYEVVSWLAKLIYDQGESIAQQALDDVNSKINFSGSFGPLCIYNIPVVSGLPLSTRGVWFWKSHVYPANQGYRETTIDGHTAQFRDEADHIWGRTRAGRWAVAQVSYLREKDAPELGRAPQLQILEVNTELVKSPEEVSRIADVPASEMYWKLTTIFEKWYEKRRKLYEAAEAIYNKTSMVSDLIKVAS